MNVSFEEKSCWITLVALVLTFTFYFWVAGNMLLAGVTEAAAFMPVFILVTVVQVLVLVVAHTAVAIASRPEGRDERDRLISWRAEHGSSWLLGTGVLLSVLALALPTVGRAWIANGLLASLVLSEVLNYGLRVLYYRRGV